MYNGPARGETMTVEDTIAKTALNLALVVVPVRHPGCCWRLDPRRQSR